MREYRGNGEPVVTLCFITLMSLFHLLSWWAAMLNHHVSPLPLFLLHACVTAPKKHWLKYYLIDLLDNATSGLSPKDSMLVLVSSQVFYNGSPLVSLKEN